MSQNDTAISVRGVSKSYTITHDPDKPSTLVETLLRRIRDPFQKAARETFWAIDDVSFDVKKGDVLGIVGRNGAGKSTLLKILSRITEPTKGEIDLFGRVASLLEVGTGFHPELTGRENIFLNGSILGMRRFEISKQFEAIVDFAEIDRFIDTPVKRYSSGMYVRLAFAVAAHLKPEILIVDEVLAVGDAQFQKKCIGKMQDVASNEGRTVLFVSHNLEAVRKLCSVGVLLHHGQLVTAGKIGHVLERYIDLASASSAVVDLEPPKEPGGPVHVNRLRIENAEGEPAGEISVGAPWQVIFHARVEHDVADVVFALGMVTALNTPLRTTWTAPADLLPGDYEIVFRENLIHLEPGHYSLVVGVTVGRRSVQYQENSGTLRIAEISISEHDNLQRLTKCGLVLNQLSTHVRRLTKPLYDV